MHTPESDRVAGGFAAEILKSRHPRLLLINFSAFDHAQHLFGPVSPEAKAALRNVDGGVDGGRQSVQGRSSFASVNVQFLAVDQGRPMRSVRGGAGSRRRPVSVRASVA